VHGPTLTKSPPPAAPQGLVLMLHGGSEDGIDPLDERSLPWRRSRWMMRQIAPQLHRAGLEVWLLRYAVRGWNAHLTSPVPDARWALEAVRREHGSLPVVLLGHSMGARTAVAVADDPSVTGVVALAPWLPRGEPVETLRGKRLAAGHGRKDRITRAKDTKYYVERAADVASSSTFTDMGSLGHYMLRGHRRWNRFAADNAVQFLVT
jgi:alpha-beta hydrolase superfamily lysophospholipase